MSYAFTRKPVATAASSQNIATRIRHFAYQGTATTPTYQSIGTFMRRSSKAPHV